MNTCKNCEHVYEGKFCPNCGTPTPRMSGKSDVAAGAAKRKAAEEDIIAGAAKRKADEEDIIAGAAKRKADEEDGIIDAVVFSDVEITATQDNGAKNAPLTSDFDTIDVGAGGDRTDDQRMAGGIACDNGGYQQADGNPSDNGYNGGSQQADGNPSDNGYNGGYNQQADGNPYGNGYNGGYQQADGNPYGNGYNGGYNQQADGNPNGNGYNGGYQQADGNPYGNGYNGGYNQQSNGNPYGYGGGYYQQVNGSPYGNGYNGGYDINEKNRRNGGGGNFNASACGDRKDLFGGGAKTVGNFVKSNKIFIVGVSMLLIVSIMLIIFGAVFGGRDIFQSNLQHQVSLMMTKKDVINILGEPDEKKGETFYYYSKDFYNIYKQTLVEEPSGGDINDMGDLEDMVGDLENQIAIYERLADMHYKCLTIRFSEITDSKNNITTKASQISYDADHKFSERQSEQSTWQTKSRSNWSLSFYPAPTGPEYSNVKSSSAQYDKAITTALYHRDCTTPEDYKNPLDLVAYPLLYNVQFSDKSYVAAMLNLGMLTEDTVSSGDSSTKTVTYGFKDYNSWSADSLTFFITASLRTSNNGGVQ